MSPRQNRQLKKAKSEIETLVEKQARGEQVAGVAKEDETSKDAQLDRRKSKGVIRKIGG